VTAFVPRRKGRTTEEGAQLENIRLGSFRGEDNLEALRPAQQAHAVQITQAFARQVRSAPDVWEMQEKSGGIATPIAAGVGFLQLP
jgi:hypothetical protein